MQGRLIFYDDLADCDSKISMGTYYADLPSYSTQFKNTIYLKDFQFQRSSFETNIFEEVDNLGVTRTTGRVSIERTSIDVIVNSNLLAYFNSLPSYGLVYLEVFEDGSTPSDTTLYRLERIEFSDNTDSRLMTGSVTLTFDLIPENKTGCCDDELTILSDYLAFWDVTDSGTKDLDSEAEFRVGSLSGLFWAWQLYFEADGITPLGIGNVELIALGVRKNGDTFTIGEFNGAFGDLLSDSSKWTGIYNIYNYFGATNSIGHNNIVEFSKKNFSFDNGFTGSETTDNAIDIQFFLAVNDSPSEKCTLPAVYSVLTSWCNQRSDPSLVKVQQQQIGQVDEQPNLTAYNETRTNLVTSIPASLTAFSLDFIDTYRKVYEISAVPGQESYSIINTTTASGLLATQQKSTFGTTNLSLAAQTLTPFSHSESPLSLTVSRLATVFYWVEQGSPFPLTGNPNIAGTITFDGGVPAFLDTNIGYHSYSLPTILPNEDVHTVKLYTNTTLGFDISLEFQYRLHRLY